MPLLLLPSPLQKATALPARRAEYFDGSEPVQNRVYKSLKVWSMLADLEESLGTFQVSCRGESTGDCAQPGACPDLCLSPQSTKAVYDRILDLRIATPQIVINYAMFLEEHKYFEESFKVRAGGLQVPGWPHLGRGAWCVRSAAAAVTVPQSRGSE